MIEMVAHALPCPFCGSLRLELGRMQNYVHCRNCGADGPEVSGPEVEARHREAVIKWNARR